MLTCNNVVLNGLDEDIQLWPEIQFPAEGTTVNLSEQVSGHYQLYHVYHLRPGSTATEIHKNWPCNHAVNTGYASSYFSIC